MLTPPFPAQSIPDVSAGLRAYNTARDEAKRAGIVVVCIQLSRGRWTVSLDTLTAPGHQVTGQDATVIAQTVRDLVQARVAVTGTLGPFMFGLEGIASEDDARALAAAMHAAVYGDASALVSLAGALTAGTG